MPSLRQIAQPGPLLLIDAASSLIQVGLVGADGRGRWATSRDEAGTGVFTCLEELEVDPQAVAGYLFCDGPGSILGIRTVAMALRTWQVLAPKPIHAYGSLALVALGLGRPEVGVIADARRDAWHLYQIGRGLRRATAAELPAELVTPEHFRTWAALPKNVTTVPYSLADLLPRLAEADLFQPTTEPDAFLHEEPSYVTWTPQIHRAPGEKA